MIEPLLWLTSVEGWGPRRILELAPDLEKLKSLWQASLNELVEIYGLSHKESRMLINKRNKNHLKRTVEEIKGKNIDLIGYFDRKYPQQLREIHDPPMVLFCKGNTALFEEDYCKMLGVVGTRKPTPYGVKITENLSRELSKNSVTIVSGMAKGIDAIAHHSAIEEYGKTIAVLGCGCDIVYPKRNAYIYEGILSNGGLIVSEFLPGTQPLRHHFPKRNRIISGLSAGVLVMEAGVNSGSLITAKCALEQGRLIMSVPGNVTNPLSKGNLKLIREGGVPVGSVDDILEEMEIVPQAHKVANISHESPVEKTLALIEPATADQISSLLGEDVYDIMLQLTLLELAGKIKRMPGGLFVNA